MAKAVETIMQIRHNCLCTGCGTCAGVCPTGAIEIRVVGGVCVPEADATKCIDCGICVASCPGQSVDFSDLNLKIFGKQPTDRLLGNHSKCYVGHSNDDEVRCRSASGGMVSQMLVSALESGLIDGALVLRMTKSNPLETEGYIARSKEEILEASGSKYCPAPSNEALRHILDENGRFAVVGLPCHMHGVRKAEEANKKLKQKIVLHIGVMCSHIVNYAGTELILEKLGIDKKTVKTLAYRGGGWPGGMTVTLKNGARSFIPLFGTWGSYWSAFSSYLFTPIRCLSCPDHTAELADISFGDAWLPELHFGKAGVSIIVARTEIAEKFLSNLDSGKTMSLMEVDASKVKQTQKLLLKFKKDFFGSRMSLLKLLGNHTPDFKIQKSSLWSPIIFAKAFYPYFNVKLSSNGYVRVFLRYVPFPLFRLYFGVYKSLSRI